MQFICLFSGMKTVDDVFSESSKSCILSPIGSLIDSIIHRERSCDPIPAACNGKSS